MDVWCTGVSVMVLLQVAEAPGTKLNPTRRHWWHVDFLSVLRKSEVVEGTERQRRSGVFRPLQHGETELMAGQKMVGTG